MTQRNVDIAIVGLGAMGAMAAWRAAERGATVAGFERFTVAHARGSSHGGSRIFRHTLFEGTEYVPLIQRADRLWHRLEAETGTSLFTRTGGLCIGPDGGELVRDALAAAQVGGFEHALLGADELQHRYPQHRLVDGDVAVHEPGAGVLDPEGCIRAAIDQARGGGAVLHFDTRVTAVEPDDTGVTVRYGDDAVRADHVILSTGAWFTDLVPDLKLPLRVQRSPLVYFTGKDRAAYRPDRFPVFVRESGDIDGWGIPDVDGTGVKIGAGPAATKPWLEHADDNNYPADERDTGPAEQFCAAAFPGLDPHAAHAVPCMNSKTPDRDFIIGAAAPGSRLVLAAGFSGHGFKHAAAVGDIAVDLALDGGTMMPLDRFSPLRFTAESQFPDQQRFAGGSVGR